MLVRKKGSSWLLKKGALGHQEKGVVLGHLFVQNEIRGGVKNEKNLRINVKHGCS